VTDRPRLELRGLTVEHGGRPVLAGVDLSLPAGGWLAVIGPNGAGKSTLLRAVAGLVPHRGEVLIDGRRPDPRRRRQLARLVAFVPQRPHLPATMTLGDYASLGRTPHLGLLASEGRRDREVVAGVLERLGLSELAGRELRTLSGGEAQRAVLARALSQEAALLLLDEPTAALDLGNVQQVLELVDALRRERAITVVSAMHDLTVAGQYAEQLLLLASGGAVAAGTRHEVLRQPLLARHYDASLEVLAIGGDGRGEAGGLAVVPVRGGETLRRWG